MDITNKTSFSNQTVCNNREIKYIVIHYTAGSSGAAGAAANIAAMFANPSTGASADFIVDSGGAVQFNPDIKNHCTWHCGGEVYSNKGGAFYGKCTNANSIGIEMCSTNRNWQPNDQANTAKWSFADEVVNNAIELTKQLMREYNIPAERVIRHYDVTGKLCPGIIGWNADSGSEAKWQAFKNAISAGNQTNTAKTTIYRVRKSANDSKSQLGAFSVFANAKKLADEHAGYSVFDLNGKLVYSPSNNKKSVTELAREVIAGKWGNGAERKNKLTAAGYDYAAVQAEVNKILR